MNRQNRFMTDTAATSSVNRLAAVDIGSNSFRLEVGQIVHGRYRRISYLKDTVRLGAGLDADGMLTREAVERGLASLRRFANLLEGFDRAHVRAVATQTLREARNRNAFLQEAESALGYPVEIISGREEARLIFAGVAFLQPSDKRRLVIDIGGRSTELILGEGPRPALAESFQLGSVSMSLRHFPDGRLTARAFREAQVAAGAELEEAQALFKRSRWEEALGASGTVGAVSQILSAAGVTDGRLTPAAVSWCIERCIEAGHVDAVRLPGLKDNRRPVLGGGLAILGALMSSFSIEELLPAAGALRQGVIVDLHGRLAGRRDMRDDSVRELQRRFAVDAAHADRVASVALARHAALGPGVAEGDERRELAWACALHEAGMIVSHHDYHRHGAYLVSNADAAGFSQSQQRRLGELVLGQRGGLRKVEAALARESFVWQLLCLRLAIAECHARADVDANAATLARSGRRVSLRFAEGWADSHPRTLHLLQQEAEAWARGGWLQLEIA
jgi:exopolyphosphatase/guanosine-5'-triphosphate,3'-diphosphate pyrophosphatase